MALVADHDELVALLRQLGHLDMHLWSPAGRWHRRCESRARASSCTALLTPWALKISVAPGGTSDSSSMKIAPLALGRSPHRCCARFRGAHRWVRQTWSVPARRSRWPGPPRAKTARFGQQISCGAFIFSIPLHFTPAPGLRNRHDPCRAKAAREGTSGAAAQGCLTKRRSRALQTSRAARPRGG